MLKNFLIRKMLRKQGVPEDQVEMALTLMEKDPQLFKIIATEIQHKIKSGMDQQTAAMQIMKKYESELKKLA